MRLPNMRVQQTRSSASPPHSPLTRGPLGHGKSRKWFGGLVLVASVALGCSSATPAVSATPKVARARSSFAQSLSLAMSLGSALVAGDTAVTAQFALTNNGSSVFEGCFGPSWGVSVIVGGYDAGHLVSVDHPNCADRLTLLPRQKILWSKKVPLNHLRAGMAKVTWLGEGHRSSCVRSALWLPRGVCRVSADDGTDRREVDGAAA